MIGAAYSVCAMLSSPVRVSRFSQCETLEVETKMNSNRKILMEIQMIDPSAGTARLEPIFLSEIDLE